jgi:hypothetical protein
MELDLQSLFVLHVHCAQLYSLAETPQPAPPPIPPHLGSYTRALLFSQDRRHLVVTPCPGTCCGEERGGGLTTREKKEYERRGVDRGRGRD